MTASVGRLWSALGRSAIITMSSAVALADCIASRVLPGGSRRGQLGLSLRSIPLEMVIIDAVGQKPTDGSGGRVSSSRHEFDGKGHARRVVRD